MMRWLPVAALLALACSGSSTMNREQLDSERKQLRALESESALFRQLAGSKHLTSTFARGHARYLQEQVQQHLDKLAKAVPAPGVEAEFRQIESRFNALRVELQ